jgi:hypothetical protein
MSPSPTPWPPLPYENWRDTRDTLHLYLQIVGKVKLALAPFLNQWWQVAYVLTARGLTTGRIPYRDRTFEVDFDFIAHHLSILTSDGTQRTIPLRPQPVAEFYHALMANLSALDIFVDIRPVPAERPDPIPFHEDFLHAHYDQEYAARWWRIQLRIATLFDKFRTSFRGKSSPIHFFWGSFDLNGTRFSGKSCEPPKMEGELARIMRYAENEENFSFGFWPGDKRFPHPAFYAYIYPAPKGIDSVETGSREAYFHRELSEFILPYHDAISARSPEDVIMAFLTATYEGSAKLGGWDLAALQAPVP